MVLQDFYASLYLANLTGILEYDMRSDIHKANKNSQNKYEYHLNTNQAIAELRGKIIELFMTDSQYLKRKIYRHIKKRLRKVLCPYWPNCSFPRIHKHRSLHFSFKLMTLSSHWSYEGRVSPLPEQQGLVVERQYISCIHLWSMPLPLG